MALAFEQQPKESDKAFAAFSLYLSMGAQRSTREVGKQLGKSEGLIERWSSRWQWTERVQAHAQHLAVVEREATEALTRGKSAEWLTRQQALRETEWEMHEKCIAAARRGLDAYMEREKVYANLSDIARMLEIASKLGRLATGMPTDKTEVTGEDGGPIKVELEVALRKIYGGEPGEIVEGEIRAPQERRPTVMEAEVMETGGGEMGADPPSLDASYGAARPPAPRSSGGTREGRP
jgi:hypothetical protein